MILNFISFNSFSGVKACSTLFCILKSLVCELDVAFFFSFFFSFLFTFEYFRWNILLGSSLLKLEVLFDMWALSAVLYAFLAHAFQIFFY